VSDWPPELETGYPEPGSFGKLPAYGVFARHVTDLTLDGIHLHTLADDPRSPFHLEDIQGATLDRSTAPRPAGAPLARLKDIIHLQVRATEGVKDTAKERVAEGRL